VASVVEEGEVVMVHTKNFVKKLAQDMVTETGLTIGSARNGCEERTLPGFTAAPFLPVNTH
jgi:hypothetical protein